MPFRQKADQHGLPGVSLFDIERHMGFPREYLDFNTWYLKAKQYIIMGVTTRSSP